MTHFLRELRATSLDGVLHVIDGAERAARAGHWVAGYVAYDAAPAFDDALVVGRRRDERLPLAWFGVFESARVSEVTAPDTTSCGPSLEWSLDISRPDYEGRVNALQERIRSGEVYQVNLTTKMASRDDVDPPTLYRQLLLAQRPAYGALLTTPEFAVISASPELFFEWRDDELRCRPMKGTRPRGRFAQEDRVRAHALLSSPKEQAENIMIVDLMRNDMAKVAALGTVHVTELLAVEEYPQVFQLVSEVRCRTAPGTRLVDVMAALFPCGSVTGAPKARAMSLIAAIEGEPRGVYCGTVGLLTPSDAGACARFNVAIRTATSAGGLVEFGTGGGIVADSRPSLEYDEMVLKAQQLRPSPHGYSLLETFRHRPGQSTDLRERHLRRLQRSARRLGFVVPPDLSETVNRELALVTVESRARVLVSPSGRVSIEVSAAPVDPRGPLRLALDVEPVSSSDPLLFHKTTHRDIYERRRRRFPDVDDVIMVNERGECTETTTANLVVRRGSAWVTPPLSSGCLPGIAREIALERGEIREGVVRSSDLSEDAEIMIINSLRGWRRAVWRTTPPA